MRRQGLARPEMAAALPPVQLSMLGWDRSGYDLNISRGVAGILVPGPLDRARIDPRVVAVSHDGDRCEAFSFLGSPLSAGSSLNHCSKPRPVIFPFVPQLPLTTVPSAAEPSRRSKSGSRRDPRRRGPHRTRMLPKRRTSLVAGRSTGASSIVWSPSAHSAFRRPRATDRYRLLGALARVRHPKRRTRLARFEDYSAASSRCD